MNFRATSSALVLAACALSACATAPEKPATLATPSEPTMGKAAEFGAPSDLDGAVRQAQLQRLAGDFDGAARTLSQLMIVAPDDPRVVGEYGKTLVGRGRTDDALAFLKRAIELNPGDWTLYSAQGVAFDQRKNYKAAQHSYQVALQIRPGEPTVLSNSALSHMQTGDLSAAEMLLGQAARSGSEDARIAQNLAMLNDLKAARLKAAGQAPSALASAKAAPALKQTTATPAPAQPAMLPAPVARAQSADRPAENAPKDLGATLSPLAALRNDPSVRMAPIPNDSAASAPKGQTAQPAPLSQAVIALQNDPSVRMAPIPREEAPVPVKRAQPKPAAAQTQVAETAKPKPEFQKAEAEKPVPATQKIASEETLTRLRPTFSDLASAKK
jgi:Flp pilus assembly protein TadD